jgi:hypothetical protein
MEGSGMFTASSTEGTDLLQLHHQQPIHLSRLKFWKSLAALYIVFFSHKGKVFISETIQSFVAETTSSPANRQQHQYSDYYCNSSGTALRQCVQQSVRYLLLAWKQLIFSR